MARCFHCREKFCGGQQAVDHCVEVHMDLAVSLFKPEYTNEKTAYRAMHYNIIPSSLPSNVTLEFNDWKLHPMDVKTLPTCDMASPAKKKSRPNVSKIQEMDSLIDPLLDMSLEENEEPTQDHKILPTEYNLLHKMQDLLPVVHDNLKDMGVLEEWVGFMELIASRRFPADNIAFKLFLDVVRWLSAENIHSMRYSRPYSKDVLQFWNIGYKLFKGRFLRFMGGYKSSGLMSQSGFQRVDLKPSLSRINFVPPDLKVLQKETKSAEIDCSDPGIISKNIEEFAKLHEDQSCKICIDGKKISSGFGHRLGDVDLFGHEGSPTLSEKRRRFDEESDLVTTIKDMIWSLDHKGKEVYEAFADDREMLVHLTQKLICVTGQRLKELRQLKVQKEHALKTFMQAAGTDGWETSKYAKVISYTHTVLHRTSRCTTELLQTVNNLAQFLASCNGHSSLFSEGVNLSLSEQSNHVCLRGVDEDYLKQNQINPVHLSRYIKQRTETWFDIRKMAKVTGSTITRSLGLNTLKDMKNHIAQAIQGKPAPVPKPHVVAAMEHGRIHECDAVATLIGKVLPMFEENATFYEEGCYVVNHNDNPFMVVSPDGSVRDESGNILWAVEIKCPVPGKQFTTDVHYALPWYYVGQVLSEMFVLQCDQLLYISYTQESTTVHIVNFSDVLWQDLYGRLVSIYGKDHIVQPKRLPEVKELRKQLDQFVRDNVTYLCEVPSVTATVCDHSMNDIPPNQMPWLYHCATPPANQRSVSTQSVLQFLYQTEAAVKEAYQINRQMAKEVLVVMLSDLDREEKEDIPHAIPIAYGLGGYSLKTDSIRNLLKEVRAACHNAGLHVPVMSFDGQYYKLCVRDAENKPLTLLQLCKDTWEQAKKIPKAEQIKAFMENNSIGCTNKMTYDQLLEVVDVDLPSTQVPGQENMLKGPIIVHGLRNKTRPILCPSTIASWIQKEDKAGVQAKEKQSEDACVDQQMDDHILHLLPPEVVDQLDEGILEKIRHVNKAISSHHAHSTIHGEEPFSAEDLATGAAVSIDPIGTETAGDKTDVNVHGEMETEDVVNEDNHTIPSWEDISAMVDILQNTASSTRSHKWLNLTFEELCNKMSSATSINQSFTWSELTACFGVVQPQFAEKGLPTPSFKTKRDIVNFFSQLMGDRSAIVRKQNPKTLRSILKDLLSRKFPKIATNIITATTLFPKKLEEWCMDSPFQDGITVSGDTTPIVWYSHPELDQEIDTYVFSMLDWHHLFVNARSTVCSKGLPPQGISRNAWLEVAKESQLNNTGLSVAMVEDLIDKQSNAFARTTFSLPVEEEMRQKGWNKEADFVRDLRECYEAEDDSGLSALERHRRRLQLRKRLLSLVNLHIFPPPGSHIKGIPVVMFEGILTNIDRRIQLYAVAKKGTFNVRALGSLDSENFFGEFTQLDPKGTGVLMPDDIPQALQTASYIMNARMATTRKFYMHMSSHRVYPVQPLLASNQQTNEEYCLPNNELPVHNMTKISLRNHAFDMPERKKLKPRRKKGNVYSVDKPSRGTQPIREHHRRDESKILPHIRYGLAITPAKL